MHSSESVSQPGISYRVESLPAQSRFLTFKKQEIEQSIAQRFEYQVNRSGSRPAIITASQILSYRELDHLANCVAHEILERGGAREHPVAVVVENDAWSLAAILGILKTGRIYVPLDFALPEKVASAILEHSGSTLIVVQEKHLSLAKFLRRKNRDLVNLDKLSLDVSVGRPSVPVEPTKAAHVLYTSGSTGQPKGVVDSHRNLLHHVMRVTNSCRYSRDDRTTLLRSPSSWGALGNAYYALLNGASLLPFDIRTEGIDKLADWLVEKKITVYHSSATVYRHFVKSLKGKDRFPSLRLIRLGSEQVTRSDLRLYKEVFSDRCILVNALSCTEAGMFRHHFFDKCCEVKEEILPVGYPVQDMEVILLDEEGREPESGGIGEIAVRSRFLACGYWNDPELTRAVFSPAAPGDYDRVYRTGDMGRMEPDGCLVHLGRRDFQVKIRGYKVQADEVETVLLGFSSIEQAAVVAREEEGADRRLIAYLVLKEANKTTLGEIRKFLKERLPDYMLPSSFVVLESLPLTPNGKVNRQALPKPPSSRPDVSSPFVAPRAPLEVVLAELWSDVLDVDPVGREDNFFELGGNSLLAADVVAKLNLIFNLDLRPFVLAEAPTIEKMAALFRTQAVDAGLTDTIARTWLRIGQMSAASVENAIREKRRKKSDADGSF